jgi:hypothetical protein
MDVARYQTARPVEEIARERADIAVVINSLLAIV